MASEDRRESPGLIDELFRSGHRFDFFQAVRVLEFWHRERAAARPGAFEPLEPVGRDDFPREVAWFRAVPSLSFPSTAIARAHAPRSAAGRSQVPEVSEARAQVSIIPAHAAEIFVTFFGLTGPSGVLPLHYTELLLRRIREKDTTSRDFFDLFNHRLISLFYRAWEKYRLVVGYERSRLDQNQTPDLITRGLYCLVGMGTSGLQNRLTVDDEVFVHYAGHFAHDPRTADALESLLTDYLGMSARVIQLHGQWLKLDGENLTMMPFGAMPAGQNNQLGVSLILGDRVWDIQSKIRIRLGPLKWRDFRSLMPDGGGLLRLYQLVRTYIGPTLDFDVQPILEPQEVPWTRLSPKPGQGAYLGWNTWIRSKEFVDPVDDAVFSLEDV
jgi:type VI secretion system protein ImpH